MKRKLAWVCLLISPLAVGGAVLLLVPRDPISQANCDRIKEGMTLKEVVAILGKEIIEGQGSRKWGPTQISWVGSGGKISVGFQTPVMCAHGGLNGLTVEEFRARLNISVDVDDHYIDYWENTLVSGAVFSPREPTTILEKLRKWLGL